MTWLQRQNKDKFVKQARLDHYRARSAYKLLEIQTKDSIFKSGMTVIDLGAAPGSWSQVAKQFIGEKGKVIAVDLLSMEAINGVEFLQGDFTSDEIYQQLLKSIDNKKVDVILSDMAPNLSGNKVIDQPRIMQLDETVLAFAGEVLKPSGTLLLKIFQGAGSEEFVAEMRQRFNKVKIRKPQASRSSSSEIYLLGIGFLG